MRRAIELAQAGVDSNAGGPFGCVVVKNGEVVGEGVIKMVCGDRQKVCQICGWKVTASRRDAKICFVGCKQEVSWLRKKEVKQNR